jgi:MFS superfamily sulfate permease-like transporter
LFRRQIIRLGLVERRNMVLDFSQCKVVDHSVMEKLHELERDFSDAGLHLEVSGLEGHKQLSEHDFAARKRAMTRLSRVTVVVRTDLSDELTGKFVEFGVSGFTSIPCGGAGRSTIEKGKPVEDHQVRIEAITSREVAEQILDYINADVSPKHNVTACLENVEVLRRDSF